MPAWPARHLPVGMPGRGQLVLSLTTHHRGKKGFTPISREIVKSRFLLMAKVPRHGGSLQLGKSKMFLQLLTRCSSHP